MTEQTDTETPQKTKKRETVHQRFRRYFVVDDIKQNAGFIRGLFSNIFSSERVVHNETFEDAVNRLNLGKADIDQSYARHQLIALCNGGIAALITLYLLYSLISADNFFDVFYCIAAVGPLVLFLSIAFRASFRCWQIRQKRLGGLSEFIKNHKEWWPRSYGQSARELRKLANRPPRKQS